jgi:ribosomal protein L11 methylase PrmA
MNAQRLGASYRDPSGFVFHREGTLFRQVNQSYRPDYEALMDSGLYRTMVDASRLVPHEEIQAPFADPQTGWKLLRPQCLGFISYPYEWSFSQLKDAALATLAIQKEAMRHGMSLKDASAYNIQFHQGKPVLIDTLSFERCQPGEPWVAYRQFCRHFLAPLALMSMRDVRLGQLLATHPDGVPLSLASKLLPKASRLKFSLLVHVHWHARMEEKHAGRELKPGSTRRMSELQLQGLIDNLESSIARLKWTPAGTEWADYYQATNYSPVAMEHKRQWVAQIIDAVKPRLVWDLGANTGQFSRVASDRGIPTVAFDVDPAAVEKNYLQTRQLGEKNLLPLLMDLTAPSPAIGWDNRERMSLAERGPADLVLALALIHHLAIAANVPLAYVARFLSRVARNLLIEFVPKSDSQVGRLLVVRKDIFQDYTQEAFEAEFGRYFTIVRRQGVTDSSRTLYLLAAKSEPA